MKKKIILTLAGIFCWAALASANNVAVSAVVLQNKNLGAGTVEVKFDLTQDNSFSGSDGNSAAFYDKIWIFVKYWVDGTNSESTGWSHAKLVSGGTLTPTSDGLGAFASTGANQVVKWNYGSGGNGISGNATIKVKVCAIEMVYIPTGNFIYNVAGLGTNTFNNYNSGSQATISGAVTALGTGTNNGPLDCAIGWPNGYNAFYIGKYEVSQGQYADFLNMLSAADATSRFPNLSANRNTVIYNSGLAYGSRYSATSPNRAMNQTMWDDLRAYLSWAALRPLTEMEFEKAARGGGTTAKIYPWGDAAPSTTVYTFDGASFSKFYANYNNTSTGPSNVGHYLSGDVTPARSSAETGASVYGVTDIAGNNWEHLINCAWLKVPDNGNGTTSWPASSTATGWPDAASGKGLWGGVWYGGSTNLRVSDRFLAGYSVATRSGSYGFRPARTAE